MTKFSSLVSLNKDKKETVFTYFLNADKKIQKAEFVPSNFENVLHIGYDPDYGDVFKCWDNYEENFTLYFGTKGDEFDE